MEWNGHRPSVLAGVVLTCFSNCSVALGQIDGGVFEATGTDVVPRYFHAGAMLQHGVVMISGGLGLNISPPSLYSRDEISFYDPDTGAFTTQFEALGGSGPTWPVLLTPRSSHTQTTLADGRVLIAGGNREAAGTDPGSPFSGVEIFDPQTGLVTAGTSMTVARAMHTATSLPDGGVVVAGGGGSWQVFSPGPDTWSDNYSLVRSRTAHAAVLLRDYAGVNGDHRVLLVGGAGSGPATMELLDPTDGTAALLSSTLAIPVDDLGAVLLADGRVFIVGGQNTYSGDTVSNTYRLIHKICNIRVDKTT